MHMSPTVDLLVHYFGRHIQSCRLREERKRAEKLQKDKRDQERRTMHGGSGGGRKREWRPMESSSTDDDDRSIHGYSSNSGNGSHNVHQGEVIEKEMKKLRLAHDYDASRSAWGSNSPALAAAAAAEPMEVEGQGAMEGGEANHNYAAKNNLLRECHYLRQLRKFQSERVRERASYFERRNPGMDAQTSYLHEPRY